MALVKYNNNSLSSVTSAASFHAGAMTHIKTLTASSSSTLSFVDGSSSVVFDNTYPIYKFKFFNMHSADTEKEDNFLFQGSTNTGSGYGVTMTSTYFWSYHNEDDSAQILAYYTPHDLAQSTSFQILAPQVGTNAADKSVSGYMTIFNPSSTTFTKHFIARTSTLMSDDIEIASYISGYFNTTSAIDAIQFKYNDANIASVDIKLYGVKDS